jgi:hypothetical protein
MKQETVVTKKILITIKTYPTPSKSHYETVCTAGIELDDKDDPIGFVRIYPIPYRLLEFDKQFNKFDILKLDLYRRSDKDRRSESYSPVDPTKFQGVKIGRIGTSPKDWEKRLRIISQLSVSSYYELIDSKKSLGVVKPYEVKRFYWERVEKQEQVETVQQLMLFPKDDFVQELIKRVEDMPYRFKCEYSSSYKNEIKKHNTGVIDWEPYAMLYNQSKGVSSKEEALKIVEDKYNSMIQEKDLYFFVGNLNDPQKHKTFLINGIFYPKKEIANVQNSQLRIW